MEAWGSSPNLNVDSPELGKGSWRESDCGGCLQNMFVACGMQSSCTSLLGRTSDGFGSTQLLPFHSEVAIGAWMGLGCLGCLWVVPGLPRNQPTSSCDISSTTKKIRINMHTHGSFTHGSVPSPKITAAFVEPRLGTARIRMCRRSGSGGVGRWMLRGKDPREGPKADEEPAAYGWDPASWFNIDFFKLNKFNIN